jgi:hypothetical protein
MIRPRMDKLPRWPGRALGMVAGLSIALAGEMLGHYLGTHVPPILADFDDVGHDVSFDPNDNQE